MFLELCCASDSVLAALVVEHSVVIRVTSFENVQLTSRRSVLHRLLMICKAYDVVVDIWVSISATTAVDDLTVLRTPREEWKLLEPFRAAWLEQSHDFVDIFVYSPIEPSME